MPNKAPPRGIESTCIFKSTSCFNLSTYLSKSERNSLSCITLNFQLSIFWGYRFLLEYHQLHRTHLIPLLQLSYIAAGAKRAWG